jgi:hypothetical protein
VREIGDDAMQVADTFATIAATQRAKLIVNYRRVEASEAARADFACP